MIQLSRASLDKLLTSQGCVLVPRVPRTKEPPKDFPLKEVFEGRYQIGESDLEHWRKQGYDRAIVVGTPSKNLVCLDFDSTEAGEKFFDGKLDEAIAATFSTRTARGVQLLYRDPTADFSKLPSRIEDKSKLDAELLIHHTLAACPGNTHPSNFIYQMIGVGKILSKNGILQRTLDRLESLHIPTKKPSQRFKVDSIIKGVNEGTRHNSAFKYSRYLLFTIRLDFDTAWYELNRWNALNHPPLSEKELQSIVLSAVNYVPRYYHRGELTTV